jgi:L-tartrate/succinate antiporter
VTLPGRPDAAPPALSSARRGTIIKLATMAVVGLVIALLPTPAGLDAGAWRYFALFVAVIIGLILEPIPAAAVGLIGVVLAAGLRLPFTPEQLADPTFEAPVQAVKWALAGFSNGTVWLIFGAFMFAMGYEKTGLGRRMALLLVRTLGGSTLGLGYAVVLADLVLAPFTPSNTARSGGTVYPIIRNIPGLYGSEPGETARRIGSYLMWTALAATCVTSSLFLTALAPNLLALDLVQKVTPVSVSWTDWLVGFLPIGVLLLATLPWVIYKVYPPEITSSSEVPAWARGELASMGAVTTRELLMGCLVVLALALWIFGGSFVDPTLVALAVIALMVLTGVVEWGDVIANKAAWNVLVWFATLVVLADGLAKVGFIAWFGKGAASALGGLPVLAVMLLLVVLYFVMHYLFASLTAHASALLPVIFAAGAAVAGVNVTVFALLLLYALGIMGVITPYATGPGPVYFASGFISRRDFWVLGLVFGAIYLVALLVIGTPWLLFLHP